MEEAEYRRQVVDRIMNELRGHGFKFSGDAPEQKETPESVQARLNISREQWDAIPNARNTWKQVG